MPLTKDPFINWKQLALKDKKAFCRKFFNELSLKNIDLVEQFYHVDAYFEDPIGHHEGINSIKKYYSSIYGPVTEISFDFHDVIADKAIVSLPWIMKFKSSKLKRGESVKVKGFSLIKFCPDTHKVIYHRDYFDLGEMIYDNIPIFGRITKWIKKRLK